MSIEYHVIKRKVPAGPDKGKEMYYGQVVCGKKVSFLSICERIADRSTATVGDAEAVLNGLIGVVRNYLLEGHIVELGKLGRLRPSAGSCGVREHDLLTANEMKLPRLVFTPGKRLRKMLNNLSYVKTNPVLEGKPCDRVHLGE